METISVLCLTAAMEDHRPPGLGPGPSRVYLDDWDRDAKSDNVMEGNHYTRHNYYY